MHITSCVEKELADEKKLIEQGIPEQFASPPSSPRSNRMVRTSKKSLFAVIFNRRRTLLKDGGTGSGVGDASLYHALIVIFLEFFAWGLLTVPVINVGFQTLAATFPQNKFLMNGLILGIKGILSFLSAPLIGALSDIWGRKAFLLLTVFCTCMPIPWLKISPWWYFALFSISGFFSVTFSVVLAYVADITEKEDRSAAYGLVSATFAASLVTSPALGAWLSEAYSDDSVIALATAIAALDVFIILVAVPESLPQKLRHSLDKVSWGTADPFTFLRAVSEDRMLILLSVVVFLSYLPEAGQFSCFFVYLKLVVGFSPEAVAAFIGCLGIMSVFAQTGVLLVLTRTFGAKNAIQIGLCSQFVQLIWYAFGTKYWMMWGAGVFAAISSLTYPAISAFVSVHTDKDKQGTVQGIITGIRGLCQGLGPAVFGFIFYLFHVDLDVDGEGTGHVGMGAFPAPHPRRTNVLPKMNSTGGDVDHQMLWGVSLRLIPGPPFLFGASMVSLAIFANTFLPTGGFTRMLSVNRRYSSSDKTDEKQRSVNRQLSPTSGMSLLLGDGESMNKNLVDLNVDMEDVEDTSALIQLDGKTQGLSQRDNTGMTIEHRQQAAAMLID